MSFSAEIPSGSEPLSSVSNPEPKGSEVLLNEILGRLEDLEGSESPLAEKSDEGLAEVADSLHASQDLRREALAELSRRVFDKNLPLADRQAVLRALGRLAQGSKREGVQKESKRILMELLGALKVDQKEWNRANATERLYEPFPDEALISAVLEALYSPPESGS